MCRYVRSQGQLAVVVPTALRTAPSQTRPYATVVEDPSVMASSSATSNVNCPNVKVVTQTAFCPTIGVMRLISGSA